MSTSDPRDRRVVVGVDGSPSSRLALQRAAHFASATGSGLDVIYAWQTPRSMGWAVHAWRPAPDQEAAGILNQIVDDEFGPDRPTDLRLIVQEGGAARILVERSRHATLLVVGSRGLGGFTGLLLGSVSRHCAEASACPVLVVPQQAQPRPIDLASSVNRIVVGVDGSPPSELGLRWAGRISAFADARIDVVTAWHLPTAMTPAVPPDWKLDRIALDILVATVDSVFGDPRPAAVHLHLIEGNPTQVLLERSRQADLLVVGSRGYGTFAQLLWGSVSAACAEHAPCPVLIVHGDAQPHLRSAPLTSLTSAPT